MTKSEEAAASKEAEDFDLSALDAADEAVMTVQANGKDWKWTFAGPGHPKGIAQSERLSRERLHEDRMKEQAAVNGRKWKAPEVSPDESRARQAKFVIERLIGWSPIKVDGSLFTFTEDRALKLLMEPRKTALLIQALEFLGDDRSFTMRSETS